MKNDEARESAVPFSIQFRGSRSRHSHVTLKPDRIGYNCGSVSHAVIDLGLAKAVAGFGQAKYAQGRRPFRNPYFL